MPTAVVLLSGGLDSAVTLASAIKDGYEPIALSFRYGQKHSKEIESAKAICNHYKIEHRIIDIDLSSFDSSLTKSGAEIPVDRKGKLQDNIPTTYVPARNIIFLSIAAGVAESSGAGSIYIGANSVDYSGYPDCRPEFFRRFEEMLSAGTKAGTEGNPIGIRTPILNLSKAEIVKKGKELNVPLHLTWSCYIGDQKACGRCDSCILRLKGFREAGYKDEIEYEVKK